MHRMIEIIPIIRSAKIKKNKVNLTQSTIYSFLQSYPKEGNIDKIKKINTDTPIYIMPVRTNQFNLDYYSGFLYIKIFKIFNVN
jgi:hypothetical protein